MISSAFHLAGKDLRLLSRDRIALFWVLGFPVLFALFIGTVVRAGLNGDSAPLKLIVVDEFNREGAARLATKLTLHERILVSRANMNDAQRAVRHADAIAYLTVPREFRPSHTTLKLAFDPAREMETAYVERLLQDALAEASGAVDLRRKQVQQIHKIPINEVDQARPGITPESASDIVFPSAVLWGLIGCAACFAVSLVAERTRGTYVRLRALPLTRHTILAGKALSALAASLSVGLLLSLMGALAFDVQVPSVAKLLWALGCTALCFVGITMALSVLGKSEQAVAGAGWATLLLMAMLGGGMVPLSLMPEWLIPVSHLSPVKWGILALEGATWRNFSLLELMLPSAILLGVGGASFLVGSVLFSRSEA